MAIKPPSPSEIAKKAKRKTYSFSLAEEPMERLNEVAKSHDVPVSYILDEMILSYLEDQKEKQNNK